MSISTLMDISPTSSGSSDYPRTLADQVGGRELTLTEDELTVVGEWRHRFADNRIVPRQLSCR